MDCINIALLSTALYRIAWYWPSHAHTDVRPCKATASPVRGIGALLEQPGIELETLRSPTNALNLLSDRPGRMAFQEQKAEAGEAVIKWAGHAPGMVGAGSLWPAESSVPS